MKMCSPTDTRDGCNRRCFTRRSAFTLIELVVVIVILGLLATLASLSLRGIMDSYQLNRAAETIELFDARARRDARRLGQPVEATVIPRRSRLVVGVVGGSGVGGSGVGGSGMRRNAKQFDLPSRVEIRGIRTKRRALSGSEIRIRFDREGLSPTYAVELQRGETRRWLLVLGASGQLVALESEGEVDAILSL